MMIPDSDKKYKKGYKYYKKKKFKKAKKYFLKSMKDDPTFPDTYAFIGLCDLALGDPQEAAKQFRIAIKKDPRRDFFKEYLGIALKEMEKSSTLDDDKKMKEEFTEDLMLDLMYNVCELQFSINEGSMEKYLFFMMKNLLDSIEFYLHDKMTLEEVNTFWIFLNIQRQKFKERKNLPLNEKIDPVVKKVGEILYKRKSKKMVNFIPEIPNIEEADKDEQHLKSVLWHLGSFVIIELRGRITKNNKLIQFLLDIVHMIEDGIYGEPKYKAIEDNLDQYIEKWKGIQQKEPSDFQADRSDYDVIVSDLKYVMNELITLFR